MAARGGGGGGGEWGRRWKENLQELQNWIFRPLFLKFRIELSHRSFCSNLSTRQADEEEGF